MKYRKLRIAWSVAWSGCCVLVIILWARSYSRVDGIRAPLGSPTGVRVASFQGRIGSEPDPDATQWERIDEPAEPKKFDWDEWNQLTPRWSFGTNNLWLVPHWFPLLLGCAIAAAPWIHKAPRQFSLRTLLIATTVVALLLGLILYATRG